MTICDYGMLITYEVSIELAKRFYPYISDKEIENYVSDINNRMWEAGIFERIGNFTGDTFYVTNDGTVEYDGEEWDDDNLYYIPFQRSPKLFQKAYVNMEDAIYELRGRLSSYLPRDFEYHKYIRQIYGTY